MNTNVAGDGNRRISTAHSDVRQQRWRTGWRTFHFCLVDHTERHPCFLHVSAVAAAFLTTAPAALCRILSPLCLRTHIFSLAYRHLPYKHTSAPVDEQRQTWRSRGWVEDLPLKQTRTVTRATDKPVSGPHTPFACRSHCCHPRAWFHTPYISRHALRDTFASLMTSCAAAFSRSRAGGRCCSWRCQDVCAPHLRARGVCHGRYAWRWYRHWADADST